MGDRAYNKWITDISYIDKRLLLALRRIRGGEFVYGRDTGQAGLLGEYCRDLGFPEILGDPVHTTPIPCKVGCLIICFFFCYVADGPGVKLVHGGWPENCELHFAYRFAKTMKYAFGMYLPLNLLVKLRRPSLEGLFLALKDSIRSSAFLGMFTAIFYYSVCLTRTRVGPKLFPKVSPLYWDKQLLIKLGCLLCGWSVLIESPKRRAEMSFFVSPRALGVFLPRQYGKEVRAKIRRMSWIGSG